MRIDQSAIDRAAQRTQEAAQRAQDAALMQLQQSAQTKLHPGEKSIVLPGGRRISAKPYTAIRQSSKGDWWLGRPYDLIKEEVLQEHEGTHRMPDGTWCLAWPNSTEEGTSMNIEGAGFRPVRWKEIRTDVRARVKTHNGTSGREIKPGEGYVYHKRLILVWVDPDIWFEDHVAPILRTLSIQARADQDWAAHVEDSSRVAAQGEVIAQGLMQREGEHVTITP